MDDAYDWKPVVAPVLRGFRLWLVALLTETFLWPIIQSLVSRRSGIAKVCSKKVIDICWCGGHRLSLTPQVVIRRVFQHRF